MKAWGRAWFRELALREVWRRAGCRTASVPLVFVLAGLLSATGGLDAQQGRTSGPPVRADTLTADSARARVLDRLKRLSAPPPSDSLADTVEVADPAADTLPDEARPAGREQVQPAAGAGSRVGGEPSDSLMAALMNLPGYSVSRYRGLRMNFQGAEGILNLFGNAEDPARFFRDDLNLAADSAINYDEQANQVRTVGRNTFSARGGDPVSSRVLIYDLTEERGTALGAETRYADMGAEWFVSGDLTSVENGRVWGSHTSFTSCDHEVPHSRFQTREIKIVADNVLVARGVTMYFADVPVFWLPFMAQTLGDGRGSGLLTPRFSVNDIVRTSTDYSRRISNIGFYWAMSDYSDATMAFDWWSGRYKALTGNVRYNWLQQFLRGSGSVRQYWREEGGTELAFDTQNNWEYDERTRVSLTARYASSSNFVRQNSFDPREVTQSINSSAGLNRRFDWGTLSASGNRQQYLSDDRVEMTLPTVNLSLSPITLFQAPAADAGPFNNITWSGSSSFNRRTVDRLQVPDEGFIFSRADETATRASINSSLNVGALSWSQSAQYDDVFRPSVPDTLFPGIFPPDDPDDPLYAPELLDFGATSITWSTGLSFRQRLIGTSTLTPRVSISGQSLRSDTIPDALSFVSAPMRVSFGAGLQTDIFGFYPGVGPFEGIRHKVTPSFSYSYTPPSEPTALQRSVFGSQELQARSQVTIGFNQTFEAKVRSRDDDAEPDASEPDAAEPGAAGPGAAAGAAGAAGRAEDEANPEDAEAGEQADQEGQVDQAGQAGQATATQGAPQRPPRDEIVNLLAVRTQAVTYDFVRADTLGFFTGGFVTTRLQNQISSDYLRGLTLSFEHDLFSDRRTEGEFTGRSFAPHLSQLNLSFSVSSRTALFQRIFGTPAASTTDRQQVAEEGGDDPRGEEDDAFAPREGFDELRMMPTRSDDEGPGDLSPGRTSPLGEWNANLSYSLRRPRVDDGATARQSLNAQMVQATLTFKPTEHWDVNWRTSYDIERGTFNDHMIRLSRDLHEWEASFDFRQTATGNWSFRFEVSLVANRDLKFDFEQRNRDAGLTPAGGLD